VGTHTFRTYLLSAKQHHVRALLTRTHLKCDFVGGDGCGNRVFVIIKQHHEACDSSISTCDFGRQGRVWGTHTFTRICYHKETASRARCDSSFILHAILARIKGTGVGTHRHTYSVIETTSRGDSKHLHVRFAWQVRDRCRTTYTANRKATSRARRDSSISTCDLAGWGRVWEPHLHVFVIIKATSRYGVTETSPCDFLAR
jgi:hypothetical protein